MTDLELTKLCAEAMTLDVYLLSPETGFPSCSHYEIPSMSDAENETYDPLHDDAQAMALVKKYRLSVNSHNDDYQVWPTTASPDIAGHSCTFHPDLNRAIVECVARMQAQRDK